LLRIVPFLDPTQTVCTFLSVDSEPTEVLIMYWRWNWEGPILKRHIFSY
jgi:hypothetical protein